jgi:hypothetical protein
VSYLNGYSEGSKTMSFGNMIIMDDRKQTLSRQMKSHLFAYLQSGSVENRALGCSLS